MTAHILPRRNAVRRGRYRLMLPLTVLSLLVVGAGIFVGFALWPTWPGAATPLEAPAIPTTVAGVQPDVPPAAIRNAVQRHTGPHDRLDLAFMWPSLLLSAHRRQDFQRQEFQTIHIRQWRAAARHRTQAHVFS